ncbi:TPA: hypothetical protein I7787_21020 [Vibrio vulnificus]|nr:hypothetical protein [Vibrio vulnificus]ELH3492600.1 hypothetical protein [Vibrio vulnificus]HAS8618174.1 hypothetical protein [Vibrio vulnificus]
MKLNINFDKIKQDSDFNTVKAYCDRTYYSLVKSRLPKLENFDTLYEETIKFLIISSQIKATQIPVNDEADMIWHEFILQTAEYRILCERYLPSGMFIDHTSITVSDRMKVVGIDYDDDMSEQLAWLGYYYYYFGSFSYTTASIWAASDFLMAYCEYSLMEVNQLAMEMSKKIQQLSSND